jgi:hypothetical protein
VASRQSAVQSVGIAAFLEVVAAHNSDPREDADMRGCDEAVGLRHGALQSPGGRGNTRGGLDCDHPDPPHANSRCAWLQVRCSCLRREENRGNFIVERDDHGQRLPGHSANPGGGPGVPEMIKATLRELPPRDSAPGRAAGQRGLAHPARSVQGILDRHLDRPAIQADISPIVVLRTITLRRCSGWRGRGEPSRSTWTSEMSSASRRASQTRSSPTSDATSAARMLARL